MHLLQTTKATEATARRVSGCGAAPAALAALAALAARRAPARRLEAGEHGRKAAQLRRKATQLRAYVLMVCIHFCIHCALELLSGGGTSGASGKQGKACCAHRGLL